MASYPIQKLQHLMPHLIFFWQVCQHRSFTAAAGVLCVSQSTVSYQIKALEEKLDIRLLERHTRKGVQLTDRGEQLATSCGPLFQGLQRELYELCDDSRQPQQVRIAGPTGAVSHFLLQACQTLQGEEPGLDFSFHASDEFLGPDHEQELEQSDIFLLCGRQQSESLQQVPLIKMHMQLVASRKYLDKMPVIRSVDDLAEHAIIYHHGMTRYWQAQLAHIDFPSFGNTYHIDNTYAILEAMNAGLGMTYLPRYVCREKLASGDYCVVLPDHFENFFVEYFLAYAKDNAGIGELAERLARELIASFSDQVELLDAQM